MKIAVELKLYETKEGIFVLKVTGEVNITKYFKSTEKPSNLDHKEDGFLLNFKEKGEEKK